jgi:hypothetical protein
MSLPYASSPAFDQDLNSTAEPHFVSLGVGMNGAEISLLSDGSASFGNFINFYAGDIAGYAKFGSAEVSLSGDAKFKSLSLSGASVDSLGSASFSNGLVTIDSLGNVFSGGFFTSSDCSLGGVNSSSYTLGQDGSATFANGTAGFDSLGNLTATNFTGGGGSSNQLTNGSYSVVLDSLGNTTFPNATVEASGLVVSQGVGSYDTIGVGSTGSLGYGLNNLALNPDGSASFSNGAAYINTDGTATLLGLSTDGMVVTMGDTTGYIKGGNLYGAPSFELWDANGRAAYFYAGSGNSGLFDARSASTNFGITINPDVSVNFGNYPNGVAAINADGSIVTGPTSQPSDPVAGQIYFDSGDAHFYGYNGTSWVQLDN